MPANLVPHAVIPELAEQVSAEMLKVLRHLQQAGCIMNGKAVDPQTAGVLRQLTDLGLVDPGYEGDTLGQPTMWVSNGNGSRVLWYLASIRRGPHYEIASSELAAWLEEQGKDRWWSVDGDPLLTGRITFPCPAEELAGELRKINRPLLVQAKKDDAGAKGQPIGKDKLNELLRRFAEDLQVSGEGQMPPSNGDRLLYLCWKGAPDEWLLVEESEITEQAKADEAMKAK
jgi:hypothetical protein